MIENPYALSNTRIEANRAKVLPTEARDGETLVVDDAFKTIPIEGEEAPRRFLQADIGYSANYSECLSAYLCACEVFNH